MSASDNPVEYHYSEEHEWVHLEDDVCTIGITHFAQGELGEVVFVELPEVGDTFEDGDETGSIESVKAVSEIYTPIAGEVVEVNSALEDAPESVNDDPFGDGWLFKLKVTSTEALAALLNAEQYSDFTQAQE